MAEQEVASEQQPYVNPEGKLTDEGARIALAWLADKWHGMACPFHHEPTKWQINRRLAQVQGYRPEGGFANYIFPAIVVTCQVCGFMVPVNAIQAGLVPPDPATDEPESDDQPNATRSASKGA